MLVTSVFTYWNLKLKKLFLFCLYVALTCCFFDRDSLDIHPQSTTPIQTYFIFLLSFFHLLFSFFFLLFFHLLFLKILHVRLDSFFLILLYFFFFLFTFHFFSCFTFWHYTMRDESQCEKRQLVVCSKSVKRLIKSKNFESLSRILYVKWYLNPQRLKWVKWAAPDLRPHNPVRLDIGHHPINIYYFRPMLYYPYTSTVYN